MKFFINLLVSVALFFSAAGVAVAGISGQVGAGYGQTYLDVKTTPGRVLGTTYTNNTGKPIKVFAQLLGTGAGVEGTITIDGVVVAAGTSTTASYLIGVYFLVPVGKTYVAAMAGASVYRWIELR